MNKFRYDGLYTSFLSMENSLPTDMILSTPISASTRDAIVAHAELVRSVTGRDVMFVGTKAAVAKLQNAVPYDIWSDAMKDERNKNGILATWEGYDCLALPRVNATGTRTEITKNDLLYIIPVDSDFKPIKHIIGGEVYVYESGMDGTKKDMTVDVEVSWNEGTAIVINELFGLVKIQ